MISDNFIYRQDLKTEKTEIFLSDLHNGLIDNTLNDEQRVLLAKILEFITINAKIKTNLIAHSQNYFVDLNSIEASINFEK